MPRRRLPWGALVLVLAGCRAEPEVSVSTRVGEARSIPGPTAVAAGQVTAYASWLASMPALAVIDGDDDAESEPESATPSKSKAAATASKSKTAESRSKSKSSKSKSSKSKSASADDDAELAPPPPPTPPRDLAAFTAMVDALKTGPIADIALPAQNLALASPALWPAIEAALVAPRKARKVDYIALLERIGGDVPNRYGHFDRAWKKAHGHDIKVSEDWYADLLALPSRSVPKAFAGIYRDCVLEAALLQAAATIGRDDPERTDAVIDALLAAAYVHEGTFRDEVGRAIRRIGDAAVPRLITRSERPEITKEDDRYLVPYRVAEYAEFQLDRLDRLQPRRAALAVQDDPRALAALLAAYGERRAADAAELLLGYIDAAIPRVRQSARASFLAYVTGPAPTAERKVLRLLGGKTSEVKARQTYRDAAAIAVRARLEAVAPNLVEETCRIVQADGSRDPICEAQPERHAHALFAHLDALEAAGEAEVIADALAADDLRETVAALDRLLARRPDLPVDDRILAVYTRAASEALAAGDQARAGQMFRKAAMLARSRDPEAGRRLTIQALLAEAEAESLAPEGRAMLLATAAGLDPADPGLAAALREDAALPRSPAIPGLRIAGGLGALLGLLGILAAIGGRTGPWLHRRRRG